MAKSIVISKSADKLHNGTNSHVSLNGVPFSGITIPKTCIISDGVFYAVVTKSCSPYEIAQAVKYLVSQNRTVTIYLNDYANTNELRTRLDDLLKRKLLVCHGSSHGKIPYFEDADTLDYNEENHPTFAQDIRDPKLKLPHKYDEILLVFCHFAAYLVVENPETYAHSKKGTQHVKPNMNTFRNLAEHLNPGGKLIINNMGLFHRHAKGTLNEFVDQLGEWFNPCGQKIGRGVVGNRNSRLVLVRK